MGYSIELSTIKNSWCYAPKVPIIQGGMGVGISLSGLASAVANAGGIGIISGTGISIDECVIIFEKQKRQVTNHAGYIGVNMLFAMNDFAEKMKVALEEKVDFIISGAGISRDMYAWGKKAIFPFSQSSPLQNLRVFLNRLGAAAVVVEGFDAGGHLGTDRPVFDILAGSN